MARTAADTLLFSTIGNFTVDGMAGADEDVAEFHPTSLGSDTSGSFSMFLDLSELGISSVEDVGSLHIID